MSDIHLNAADVRVMRRALLRFAQAVADGEIKYELPSDEDRARRLERVMGYYNVTEEVNNEPEAQHEAPEPRPVLVQEQGPAERYQSVIGPDPVGRQALLIEALRNLKALGSTSVQMTE